jgi:hypothetical protein
VVIIAITAHMPDAIGITAIMGIASLPIITGTVAARDTGAPRDIGTETRTTVSTRTIGTITAITSSHTAATAMASIGRITAGITVTTVRNLPAIGITMAIAITARERTVNMLTTSSLIIAITVMAVTIGIMATPSIAATTIRNVSRITIATITNAGRSMLAAVTVDLAAVAPAITAIGSLASAMAITNRVLLTAAVRTRSAPADHADPVDRRLVIALLRHRMVDALQISSGSWITCSASSRNYGKR